MLAGTSFRGQYEDRIRRLIQALQADRNLILFVDELHNLIGRHGDGGGDGRRQHAEARARARRHRVIGATTGEEYNKWIKTDPHSSAAFSRSRSRS